MVPVFDTPTQISECQPVKSRNQQTTHETDKS